MKNSVVKRLKNSWWLLTILGIVSIIIGIWLFLMPVIGYVTIAFALGWLMLVGGIIQIALTNTIRKEIPEWGWWLVGGIFDVILGFILVTNLTLTEMSLPFFFGFIFLFKGISYMVSGLAGISRLRYWWGYLINGILLIMLSILFFIFHTAAAFSIVILCSCALVFWGIGLIASSFDLRSHKDYDMNK